MQFENLMECLLANNIKVNRKFAKAYTVDGCIQAYRPLFEGIVSDIGKYLYDVINSPHGFTHEIRDNLEELIDLVVKISKEGSAAGLEKTAARVQKIKGSIEKDLPKKKRGEDMKNEILKKIAAYRAAISIQKTMPMAQERVGILDDSLKKLDQLETALGEVIDVSSKDALSHAKKIVQQMEDWSEKVAQYRHDSRTAGELDAVIATAYEWGTLRKVKAGLFGARSVNIDEIRFDGDRYETADPLESIALSAGHLENIDIFRQNLIDYKKAKEEEYALGETEAQMQQYQEQKKALEEKKAELIARYNNGEISREDLGYEAAALKRDFEDVEADMEDLLEETRAKREGWAAHQGVLKMLDGLLRVINSRAKTDLETVAYLGEQVDFNALHNMMKGRATREEADSIRVLQQIEDLMRRAEDGSLSRAVAQWNEDRRRRRDETRAARKAAISTVRKHEGDRTQVAEENAAATDWILGAKAETAATKPEEKEETAVEQFDPNSLFN